MNKMEKMSQRVIISNQDKFEQIKANFIKDRLDLVHIITDFDGTLTKANYNETKRPSIISVLRDDENYLGKEYTIKAHKEYDTYHPIEINNSLDINFRKQKMDEWWKVHLNLLIESKLKFEHIEKVANSGIIELKNNCKELLQFTNTNNIPVVIMSANAIGDTISIYLDYNDCLFPNIHYITNHFKFDNNGFAIEYSLPIVHSLNKDETVVSDFPDVFKKIKTRKNVILIGDGDGDSKMSDGFEYNNIIKIGFLNSDLEEKLEYYKSIYDVVIIGDENIDFVLNFLKEIK